MIITVKLLDKSFNKKHTIDYSINRKNDNMIFLIVPVFVFSVLLFSVSLSTEKVFAQSPYNSGYDHGCNDAKVSDSDNRYINQPGKGSEYHTSEFMNGYRDGFNSCSDIENNDNNNDNQRPVANAGPNREIFEGDIITLDGRDSYDPDGRIVDYSWASGDNDDPDCPNGAFDNNDSPTPQFTAPDNLSKDCHNLYDLDVTDNDGKKDYDSMVITVKQR